MSVRGYFVLLGALAGLLVVVEATRPRPLDLTVSLEPEGADPFDAEVFAASLPEWLGQPVELVAEVPYDRLGDSSVTGRTYLFLADAFVPGEAEAARLLGFVARGNTVVVAAHDVRGPFGDSLRAPALGGDAPGLRTQRLPGEVGGLTPFLLPGGLRPDTLGLVAPGAAGAYGFPVGVGGWEIVGADSARAEVLGIGAAVTGEPPTTLARVRYGRGDVVVSSTPLAFSNAALTGDGDGPAYVGAVLAALPAQPVWWDASATAFAARSGSPLRFVLLSPPLRLSYGLLLLAGVLYVAFRGRRWQRAVPVVEPPPNAQREFARVLGRLHFVHRDDGRLARRMARLARDRLRTDLGLDEPDFEPETARIAAARAGVPEDEALGLFATLRRVERERAPDADTLVRLDARVARFFRHTA